MKRIFIALPIPPEISASLIPLQNGLENIKFSPPANFHITLCFIGDLSEDKIEELDNLLGEIETDGFILNLEGVDYFGKENPHSLHARLKENESLNRLHNKCKNICKQIGIELESRKYTPHVTLGYFRRNAPLSPVVNYCAANALFKSKNWRADRFYLYESIIRNGPSQYQILAQYPLKAPI